MSEKSCDGPYEALIPGPVPLYEQIKVHVRDLIATGKLREGDRVSSENQLAATFKVARLTVHRALRELSQEGIIHRVHGLGSFVAPQRITSPTIRVYNIAEEVRSRGQAFSAVVKKLGIAKASGQIALGMEVKDGIHLFHSTIIYYADGVPVQLEDRYVLPSFAPSYLDQDFHSRSTTDYLQSISPATEAEQIIEAIIPDATTKTALKFQKGEACLVVTRKTWVNKLVTTYTRFVHPGMRHRLVSHITGIGATMQEETSFAKTIDA
jgi:GntR family histidine utilization transcriptional repressor